MQNEWVNLEQNDKPKMIHTLDFSLYKSQMPRHIIVIQNLIDPWRYPADHSGTSQIFIFYILYNFIAQLDTLSHVRRNSIRCHRIWWARFVFDGHLDLFLAPKVYIVRCFESHSPVFNVLCQIKISFNFILTLNWTFIILMCPNIRLFKHPKSTWNP